MYQQSDRKTYNRSFQEAATQRKAGNDTQYFWDLVHRSMSGHTVMRRANKSQEEKMLFSRSADGDQPVGAIDDSIPVQRSGPKSEEIEVLSTFHDLEGRVPGFILRCVELLRFDVPTPIQKHALPLGLAGLDLMCCAQTGSGKTFAFLVPVVSLIEQRRLSKREEQGGVEDGEEQRANVDQRGVLPEAIVLAPTRELASQIHLDARRLTFGSGLRCVCVYGGNDIRTQLLELSMGCDIIIATPGRLNDLVDRGVVSLAHARNLVLDEGDRMLDMGFEPQIRRIVLDYDMPRGAERQTFLFSATFPAEIQALAREFLREYVWIAVGRVGSTVDNIKQQVLMASADPTDKIRLLLSVLDQTTGRTLLFVQKRKTASWLCDCLRSSYRVAVEEIHGDRSQAQRENALKLFRDGSIRILVATDVAARGLDVPAVTHVIQFDMPISTEDFDVYVHRIGRTGRAGMAGLATSFFVPGREIGEGNGKIAVQLLHLLRENKQDVPDWLPAMADSQGSYGGGGGAPRRSQQQSQGYGNSSGYGGRGNGHSQGRFGYQDFRSNQQSVMYQHPAGGAGGGGGGGGYVYGQAAGRALQQGYVSQQQGYSQHHYGNAQVPLPPQSPALMVPSNHHAIQQQQPAAGQQMYQQRYPAQAAAHSYGQPSVAAAGYYDPYSGTYVPTSTPQGSQMETLASQFQHVSMQAQPQQQQWAMAQGYSSGGGMHGDYGSSPGMMMQQPPYQQHYGVHQQGGNRGYAQHAAMQQQQQQGMPRQHHQQYYSQQQQQQQHPGYAAHSHGHQQTYQHQQPQQQRHQQQQEVYEDGCDDEGIDEQGAAVEATAAASDPADAESV